MKSRAFTTKYFDCLGEIMGISNDSVEKNENDCSVGGLGADGSFPVVEHKEHISLPHS